MNATRAIVRALRLSTRAIERELGISLAQLWVLQILEEHPGRTLNELAAATATHQSSVSVVVQRLVQAAFVTRTADAQDKRQRRVELTAAGRALLAHAPTTVQVQLIGGLRRMAPEHRDQLSTLMREWLTASGLDLSIAQPMLMEDEA
jgi:DNA-binding MarR family transcriptional regulator